MPGWRMVNRAIIWDHRNPQRGLRKAAEDIDKIPTDLIRMVSKEGPQDSDAFFH